MSLLIQGHTECLKPLECLPCDALPCRYLLTASGQMVQVRLITCLVSEMQKKTLLLFLQGICQPHLRTCLQAHNLHSGRAFVSQHCAQAIYGPEFHSSFMYINCP